MAQAREAELDVRKAALRSGPRLEQVPRLVPGSGYDPVSVSDVQVGDAQHLALTHRLARARVDITLEVGLPAARALPDLLEVAVAADGANGLLERVEREARVSDDRGG